MKIGLCFLLFLLTSSVLSSQTQESPAASSPPGSANPASVDSAPTVSLQPDLDKLQATGAQAAADIERLKIDKWKASGEAKSAAQADADSVRRNLTAALPGLIANVRSAPEDLNAEFKLYRNLSALYDVFGTLTQTTRTFGRQSDYEALSQHLQVIGSARRKLGDTLEQLTATQQGQINQMRILIASQKQQLAAAAAAPPKESVVAQAEPPKKVVKKKVAPKKPAPAATTSGASSTDHTGTGTTVPKS